jgi:hypothetical protein
MSTVIGTLQAPRKSLWPTIALALLTVVTLAIVAATMPATTDQPEGRFVGRHVVNTPSEFSGGVGAGLVGGTAANTPSELSGAFERGRPGQDGQRGPAGGIHSAAEWPQTAEAIAEAVRYDRYHHRI